MTGYYLYGFVTADAVRTPFANVPFAADVSLIRYQDVAAVVRPIDPDRFAAALRVHLEPPETSPPKTKSPDISNNRWLAEQAVAHDAVIGQYIDVGICPVRFGTILPSEQALLTLLERSHMQITHTLAELTGKKEWTLRVWLVGDAATPAPAQGGRAYLQARRAELSQKNAQRQQCEQQQHAITRWLQQADIPFVTQERRPADRDGQLGVCELVVLLRDEEVAQWQARFADVSDVGTLEHTLSGPFAPYHFSHFDTDKTELTKLN